MLAMATAPISDGDHGAPELHPLSLRFRDDALETSFRERYFRDNLLFIRIAHVLGILSWVIFGVASALVLLPNAQRADLTLRFGVAVPIAVVAFALTWASWYPRAWHVVVATAIVLSGFIWSLHGEFVPSAVEGWSYAGLMIVLVYLFALSRLRFVTATVAGAIIVTFHIFVRSVVLGVEAEDLYLEAFFVVMTAAMGAAGAYALERFTRLFFLREIQLDTAREEADTLLLNTLPRAIVGRLKSRHARPGEQYMADGLPEVSVLFADLVDFTAHAEAMGPQDLIVTLDDVFSRFDVLASRLGLEKIKTVGDAYMVVAGAPEPRPDHAEAAAEMAFGILGSLTGAEWPNGDPMQVRIGIASGPAVAGVIGRERFAYDLWGDTVNLASRLEANSEPGRILVSAPTYDALKDTGRYRFSDGHVVSVKGKGPTPARFLLGRDAYVLDEVSTV
jgi:class 3 adenylate cyclase